MRLICPNCGTVHEDGWAFCSVCGTILQPETPDTNDLLYGNTGEFTTVYDAYETMNTEGEIPAENEFTPSEKQNLTDKKGKKEKKDKKGKKSGKKFIFIGLAIIAAILLIVFIVKGTSSKIEPIGKTVMIYVVGSDLESEDKYATLDLSEITRSGVNTEKNNILVCTGGTAQWHNDYVTADENAILKLNGTNFEKVESYPVSNMAESSTLTRFINYGMSNYPNDQYVLILWNHGGGPIFGYGEDQLHPDETGALEYDLLTHKELQTALKDAQLGPENKLELIGFDACVMANIETGWSLKDYANYLVASQENEPGTGWDYSFLNNLESYQDGMALATKIIDSYYTTTLETHKPDVELTLSCMDLSKIDETEKCLNELFADVNSNITDADFSELSKKRYETKEFDKTTNPFVIATDIVDLNHLAVLLEDKYPEKAKALQKSISELVCYSQTNVKNSSGVSVWYPYTSSEYINAFIDVYNDYDFADNYTKYILSFALSYIGMDAETAVNYSDVALKLKNSNITAQLTPQQAASLAGVQYIVYGKIDEAHSLSGKDEYIPVFVGEDFLIEELTLRATYDTKALFAIDGGTGDDHGMPIFLDYVHDGSGDLKYTTSSIFSKMVPKDDGLFDRKSVIVDWVIRIEGDEAHFGEAIERPEETDEQIVSTNRTINPDDYESYSISNPSYFAKVDKNGNTTFERSGNIYGYYLNKDVGYELEYREIEDPENYYVCFKFIDVYGNETYSNLTPLVQ